MKQRIAVLLMLGLMPWADLRAQQSASATFKVTARVEAGCEVMANNLESGTYTAQGRTLIRALTLLRATCSPDSSYGIGLNERTIWSDTAGTDTVIGVGTGISQDHRVFGSGLAAQAIPAGGHADTIVVRIYY